MRSCYLFYLFIIVAIGFTPLHAAFDYPAYSARSAAMANSYVASTFACDGFMMNPALLSNATSFYGALNYAQLFALADLRYANGMAGMPVKSFALGLGIEDFGNSLYRETKLALSASKLFYNNLLSIGISFQFYNISVQNYGNSSTIGLNLGIRYQILPALHVAGAIENFNQPRLNGYGEEIPQRIQVGFQYKPLDQLAAHFKIQKDSWFSPEALLGIEYQIFNNLELYSGYSTLGTIPSFGVLLNIKKIEISYAMQYHFDLGPTHFAGIAFNPKS